MDLTILHATHNQTQDFNQTNTHACIHGHGHTYTTMKLRIFITNMDDIHIITTQHHYTNHLLAFLYTYVTLFKQKHTVTHTYIYVTDLHTHTSFSLSKPIFIFEKLLLLFVFGFGEQPFKISF